MFWREDLAWYGRSKKMIGQWLLWFVFCGILLLRSPLTTIHYTPLYWNAHLNTSNGHFEREIFCRIRIQYLYGLIIVFQQILRVSKPIIIIITSIYILLDRERVQGQGVEPQPRTFSVAFAIFSCLRMQIMLQLITECRQFIRLHRSCLPHK